MQPATFTDVLRAEVARMQAAHPEREGEIARACALITQGFVTDLGNGDARVLSSDLQRSYTVNGSCTCQGAQHGKPCKHRAAWLLYQHVQKKVGPTVPPASTEPPLPEAPISMTAKALVRGFEVLITVRGTDAPTVLAQLQTTLDRKDVTPIPKPQPRQQGQWRKPYNQNGR